MATMNKMRPNDEPVLINSYRAGGGDLSEYEALYLPGISLAQIPGGRVWINNIKSYRSGWVSICVQELNWRKRRGKRYDMEIPLGQPFKLLHRRWIARDKSIARLSGTPITQFGEAGPGGTGVERFPPDDEPGVFWPEQGVVPPEDQRGEPLKYKQYFPIVKVPVLEIQVLAVWQGRMRSPVPPSAPSAPSFTPQPITDLRSALQLARRQHAGQTDLAGAPYVDHVMRVVASVTGPQQMMAAALHDVLEDTSMTAGDLTAMECPTEVMAAVVALTREEGEDYDAFVHRAARNPIARVVKRADVTDNCAQERLSKLPAEVVERLRAKYLRALAILAQANPPGGSVDVVTLPARRVFGSYQHDGSLSLEGNDYNGPGDYTWVFTFHPSHFDAIRRALGGLPDSDVLELLAAKAPTLPDRGSHDPGGWLRNQGIPADLWNWVSD